MTEKARLSCLPANTKPRRAFTLVELSIVLVILGLLVGGVLSGQSLIRAAELRTLVTTLDSYRVASRSFQDKYFAMPGDMRNATRFWGRMSNSADCISNIGATATGTRGTCDGNGDGIMNTAPGASQSGEEFQAWKQMANAGLIEGNYTGVAGSAGMSDTLAGTNIPATRISNAGCYIHYFDNSTAAATAIHFGLNYKNVMTCGAKKSWNDGPFLKPEEAWNIDMKMDDGRPAQGFVGSVYVNCTTAANALDFSGEYAINGNSNLCALRFKDFF